MGPYGTWHIFYWGVADLVKLGKKQKLQNLKITLFLHKPSKHAPKGHIMRISPPPPQPPKIQITAIITFITVQIGQRVKHFSGDLQIFLSNIETT